MQLVLDKFGRMVLPKDIRQRFGLHAGDVLDAVERGDTLVLQPALRQDAVAQKRGVLVFTGKACGDIERAVADHRHERLEQAAVWKVRS